jgi:hypothetical protein
VKPFDISGVKAHNMIVRRVAAIALLLTFALMGSGALDFAHREVHALQHADKRMHGDDENDCPICFALHAPILSGGFVPLLVCLGLFVAFLTLTAPTMTAQTSPIRLTCRGPPNLVSI